MSIHGWTPAAAGLAVEVPPVAEDSSVRTIPVSTLHVNGTQGGAHGHGAAGCLDPMDSAQHGFSPYGKGAQVVVRSSISLGDALQTPRTAGKTRRVSLLVDNVAVAPAAEDAGPRKDQQPQGPDFSLDTAAASQSSKSFATQRARRRSKLMMPGGEATMTDDSIDEIAAMAAESRFCGFRPKVIMPNNDYYMVFWYFTMGFALANAVLDPYDLAFGSSKGWEAGHIDFWSIIEYIGTVVFLVDIILKFFLAYEDEERKEMVTDFRGIAKHYLSFMFWLDVLFWFPFVGVIMTVSPQLGEGPPPPEGVNIPDPNISVGYYVGLLGFLKLGRLYRIFHLFDHLDHTMIISQMSLMLLRNFVYIMLTCHWFACIFYFIGRAEQYSVTNSWMGRNLQRFEGLSAGEVYIYSFYLSVTAFAGLGDGDFYSNSPAESIAMTIYLLFNVVLGAYILGTVTMLMVKGDERSKSYRDRISNLKDYTIINELPQELHDAMRAHLELHYQSEQVADEAVLALYPSAIRRKVLRHLYLDPLRNCYLFKACKPKFLDAVLAACRTDLFMPNVHLVNVGDIVSELYMMIEGEVEVQTSRGAHALLDPHSRPLDKSSVGSTDAGSTAGLGKSFSQSIAAQSQASGMSFARQNSRALTVMPPSVGPVDKRSTSECFGEVAFFTEVPSTDSVWTVSVVRVLVLPRRAYIGLAAAHPNQVRSLVDELRKKTERDVVDLLSEGLDNAPSTPTSIHDRLGPWAPDGQLVTAGLPPPLMKELRSLLTLEQAAKLAKLEQTRSAVVSFCLKQDRMRVYEMLSAASKGEDDTIKTLISHGVSAACADSDQRTPLLLAAQEGKESTVKLLLDSGAHVNAADVFGNSALIAAIKHGHDYVIEALLAAGATLAGCSHIVLSDMLESVIQGDLGKLVRYLRGLADPNMANHDQRTPLHMAAAEGSLAAVRILIEAGANPNVRDRWGNQPVDDARTARAMPVVEFLEQHGAVATVKDETTAAALQTMKRQSSGASGDPAGLSSLNRGLSRRRRTSALSLDPHTSAQLKAAHMEREFLRSTSGASGLSGLSVPTSRVSSPPAVLGKPSSLKRSASSGIRKSVVLRTLQEDEDEGVQGRAAARPAKQAAGRHVPDEDLAAVSALLGGDSKTSVDAPITEPSDAVFVEEAPLIALDDFALFAERIKEEKEHFERGLSQVLSQATTQDLESMGEPVEPPSSTAMHQRQQQQQQGEAHTALSSVKRPEHPAKATLEASETSSSSSPSPAVGSQAGAQGGEGSGQQEEVEGQAALVALTAAAQALAAGPGSGSVSRATAVGPPPRTSPPAAQTAGAAVTRRPDSPLGPSPLGRTPGSGPPDSPTAMLASLAAPAQQSGRRPNTSAVGGLGAGPIPAMLVPDPGRRPSTQPVLAPPGSGPLGLAPAAPGDAAMGAGGAWAGDQPRRPGSPLSFHMAQLMESMVQPVPEGSRRASIMSQGSGGRHSGNSTEAQPVHWRDSPLFGTEDEAAAEP